MKLFGFQFTNVLVGWVNVWIHWADVYIIPFDYYASLNWRSIDTRKLNGVHWDKRFCFVKNIVYTVRLLDIYYL